MLRNAVKVTDARGNVGYSTRRVEPCDRAGGSGRLPDHTFYDVLGNPTAVVRLIDRTIGYVDASTDLLAFLVDGNIGDHADELRRAGAVGPGDRRRRRHREVRLRRLRYRTSYTNKLGGATQFTYDQLGRKVSEQLPAQVKAANGSSIALVNRYSYDARGNRISVSAEGTAEQRATTYGYDALDRHTDTAWSWR